MLYSKWLSTPFPLRIKVAQALGIQQNGGGIEVASNEVKQDGFLLKDIETKITVASLQEYLKITDKNDLNELYDILVESFIPKEEEKVVPPPPKTPTPEQVAEALKIINQAGILDSILQPKKVDIISVPEMVASPVINTEQKTNAKKGKKSQQN